LPDYGAVDMHRFFAPHPIYPVILSRGCYWGECSFCSYGWRVPYRVSSEEQIRKLARHVSRTFGGRYVQLHDSSVPPEAARMFCEAVADEGLGLVWTGEMKFDRAFLDPEYCRTLGRGGCRSILMGLESANPRILKLMRKGFLLEEVPRMLANLRENGVSTELLWFIGFPTETREDVLRTVQWLVEHRELYGMTSFVGNFGLHPDADVYAHPGDYGITISGHQNGYGCYVAESGMMQEEALELTGMLAHTNNRTLAVNGSQLLHLDVSGLDLTGLARPMSVPPEVVRMCRGEGA
jgi:radical SAM superfamily enzyme YgiQ (UPF0313 family)